MSRRHTPPLAGGRVIAPSPRRRSAGADVRGVLALCAWLAALVAVFVLFAALGRGALAGPDLTAPASWPAWAEGRSAPEAAFAILRMGVQVVAVYLFAATLVALAASIWQGRRMMSVAEVVTVPLVRRMVHGMVGVSLAGASVAGFAATDLGGGGAPRGTAADIGLASASVGAPAAGGVESMAPLGDASSGAPPVMRLVGEPATGATGGSGPSTGGSGAPTPPDAVPAEPAGSAAAGAEAQPASAPEWVVEPGDHLWSVSHEVLTTVLERPVSDAEVSAYLDVLVQANADRLADPGNADLLYPGQRLVLPPAPSV